MSKKHVVQSIPHVLGTRGLPRQNFEAYSNERMARAAGYSERDRHDYRADKTHQWNSKVKAPFATTGGRLRDRYGETLRPMPHRVFARKLRPSEMSTSPILIAETYDEHRRVDQAVRYEVLAIGDKVTDCKVGDIIVSGAAVGECIGDWYADDVWVLWANVPNVNEGESDVERRTGGDIWAVCEP